MDLEPTRRSRVIHQPILGRYVNLAAGGWRPRPHADAREPVQVAVGKRKGLRSELSGLENRLFAEV